MWKSCLKITFCVNELIFVGRQLSARLAFVNSCLRRRRRIVVIVIIGSGGIRRHGRRCRRRRRRALPAGHVAARQRAHRNAVAEADAVARQRLAAHAAHIGHSARLAAHNAYARRYAVLPPLGGRQLPTMWTMLAAFRRRRRRVTATVGLLLSEHVCISRPRSNQRCRFCLSCCCCCCCCCCSRLLLLLLLLLRLLRLRPSGVRSFGESVEIACAHVVVAHRHVQPVGVHAVAGLGLLERSASALVRLGRLVLSGLVEPMSGRRLLVGSSVGQLVARCSKHQLLVQAGTATRVLVADGGHLGGHGGHALPISRVHVAIARRVHLTRVEGRVVLDSHALPHRLVLVHVRANRSCCHSFSLFATLSLSKGLIRNWWCWWVMKLFWAWVGNHDYNHNQTNWRWEL